MKQTAKRWIPFAVVLGILTTSPALAQNPHAGHGAHAAVEASVTKTLAFGKQKATLVIEDAQEYFNKQHEAHPNHPGIPTHRVVLTYGTGTVPASGELTITLPSKQTQTSSMWKEGKTLQGQIELREKGTYRFTLAVPQGKAKRTATFTLTR